MENTLNITVSGPESRTTVSTNTDTTIADILDTQGINFAKASVMLNGVMLPNDSLYRKLNEIGVTNGSVIAVCVKLQNA